jgi:hypothetical protein
MFVYLIMSNYNLIRLLSDISNNHLFYKWKINDYRSYMNNLIRTSDYKGSNYIYNCFKYSKLPFVVFRTDDTYYYIDKNKDFILVNKLDKSFCLLDEFDLGHKNSLGFYLKYIAAKV